MTRSECFEKAYQMLCDDIKAAEAATTTTKGFLFISWTSRDDASFADLKDKADRAYDLRMKDCAELPPQ